jgi:NADPH-dependent curcumin reductase CurA
VETTRENAPSSSQDFRLHIERLAMAEVDNKQVIFKGYIERTPAETDMGIKVSKIKLEAPKGSGAFLVKNLYLSCDPYLRGRMRDVRDSYIPSFVPGQVNPQPILEIRALLRLL